METKRIIEVGGVKVEVDLREATQVNQYHVGDRVKILVESYGGSTEVYDGVILDFYDFKSLPSIQVGYLKHDEFVIVTVNSKSEKLQLAPCGPTWKVDVAEGVNRLNRKLTEAKNRVEVLEQQRKLFIAHFGMTADEVKGE